MELTKRSYPTTLIVIVALHFGLFLLVMVKPKAPSHGNVSYMELLPALQLKPRSRAVPHAPSVASLAPAKIAVARRQPAKPADRAAAPRTTPEANATPGGAGSGATAGSGTEAAPPEVSLESAAPDFAAVAKPIDIDQLRKQAAKNDTESLTPLDKVREQERRRKSIETTVAAAAKAGARKDCQNAYAGLGVLAIFPLIYGTVTDNGCKWK
jgi:hypothetical protein